MRSCEQTNRGSRLVGSSREGETSLRVLLHDCSGHPFQVQLSRQLAARGHTVHHVYCSSFLAAHGALERHRDDPDTFSVEAIELAEPFDKYRYHRRLIHEVLYGRALVRSAQRFEPDVMISCNDPLFTKSIGARWCQRTSTPWVFWLQDYFSEGMADEATSMLGRLGAAPTALFRGLEGALLRRADHVVAISEDFIPNLERFHVPVARRTLIENWAPIANLPQRSRHNAWAHRHDLVGRTVLLYAGTLGRKHDPGVLLQLAQHARSVPDAVVVVCSEGPSADSLRAEAEQLGLENMVVLPFQPFEDLPDVLASADVLLVLLEAAAGRFSVPSKVLTSLCAGRPIAASMPRENLAARTIERAGAGIVTRPGERSVFVNTALRLATTEEGKSMGRRARAYAETTFDIESITDRFEAILEGSRTGMPSSKEGVAG